jgi:hypothetical protein
MDQGKRVRFAAWIDNKAQNMTKQQDARLKAKISRGSLRRSARLRSQVESGLKVSGPVAFVSNPSPSVSIADLQHLGPVTPQPVGLSFAERMKKLDKTKLSVSSAEALGSHPIISQTTRNLSRSRMSSYFYTTEGLSSDSLSNTTNLASHTDTPITTPQPAANVNVGPSAKKDLKRKFDVLYSLYATADAERRDLRRNCDKLREEKSDLQQVANGAIWVAEDWLGERYEGQLSGPQAILQLSEMRQRCQWYQNKIPSIRPAFDSRSAAEDAMIKSQVHVKAAREEAKEKKKDWKNRAVEDQKNCPERKQRVEAWGKSYGDPSVTCL